MHPTPTEQLHSAETAFRQAGARVASRLTKNNWRRVAEATTAVTASFAALTGVASAKGPQAEKSLALVQEHLASINHAISERSAEAVISGYLEVNEIIRTHHPMFANDDNGGFGSDTPERTLDDGARIVADAFAQTSRVLFG